MSTPAPIGGWADMALIFHDMYLAFAAAGFTPPQAMYLVAKVAAVQVAAALGTTPNQED